MREPLAALRRLAIAMFALACVATGTYVVRPGQPTPPAVIVLAAELETEQRADVRPVMRAATLRRAAEPLGVPRPARPPMPRPLARPAPRGPPAPHGEPRGPPARA